MFVYRSPTYSNPGVFFEWVNTASDILSRRTDIAGFVGIAGRGDLHTPVKVESWSEFTSIFGGHIRGGYLAYAVEGFFANGGRACWIVRGADPKTARKAVLELKDDSGHPALRLTASSPGAWARNLSVSVMRNSQNRFTLIMRLSHNEQEVWRDLTLDGNDQRFAEAVINDEKSGSRLVTAMVIQCSSAVKPSNLVDLTFRLSENAEYQLNGGHAEMVQEPGEGLETLSPAHISGMGAPAGKTWGLSALEAVDEIGIVAIPDIMPKFFVETKYKEPRPDCEKIPGDPLPPFSPTPTTELPPPFDDEQIAFLQLALIGHCEKLRDRVAILDFPCETIEKELDSPSRVLNLRRGFDTSYAALYYPWVLVPDPLYLTGLLRAVPPSGHLAGVYARCDLTTGVHKPPANEIMASVTDVLKPIDDITHGLLNDAGVNVIRSYPGRGLRIAGARTLKQKDPAWRYVNVRRLLLMIEATIDQRTRWTVFESNNPDLWREMDRVVRSYLDDLWRRGMLDGATAEEAYFVRCDETTNPSEETAKGRLICIIGVLPPWPAEFVVVRIGKTEGGTRVLEESGGQNG